jgi:hypothetical protein
MAVTAVNTETTDVVLVAKGDRLFNDHAHLRGIG